MTDREKLISLVYEARVHADEECDKRDGCSCCPYDAQADMCQTIPIVDHLIANGVVVREKGEWRNNKDDYPECTRCGYMPQYDPMIDDIYLSDFCPYCGSDMRGGKA